MKKKILYLFSDTGGGHRSAAAALMRAVDEIKKNDAPMQEMVDVFSECSSFLNIFAKLYTPVIKYSPKMWGMLYYWLNDMKKIESMEKFARPFMEKELCKLILKRKPDVIVSVHPLLNHLSISAMRTSGYIVPLITVITDPVSLHRSWICREADLIIVATEEARKLSIEYGADPRKLKVIGLPIDPRFMKPARKKNVLLKEMGLYPNLFTALLMGGGEGAGKMFDIVKELDKTNVRLQLIVIAGRNESLRKKLESLASKLSFPIKIYGFTNEVPDIMSASDIIVTKAGPGSIAEALAKELPIIITSWLPGQEEGNVKFVLDKGLGKVSADTKEIVKAIKKLHEPLVLQRIKRNIRKASDPKAVYQIAKAILSRI